jgi:hypothetical protein
MPAINMAKLDDAVRILKSGEIRQGMEILEDLLRAEPENVNVLYNLGEIPQRERLVWLDRI